MNKLYNKEFYNENLSGSEISAKVIVPLILSQKKAKSVIDIGCGTGIWLSEFKKSGVEDICGVDGDWVNEDILHIPYENFIAYDLNKTLNLKRKYDIAISVEVAEHVLDADNFVNNLVNLSDYIVFSAAVPGQGGTEHINEQWNDYWIKKFEKHGYKVSFEIRKHIWNNPNVEFWYSQNIMIFNKQQDDVYNYDKEVYDVIHPRQYYNELLVPIKELYTNKQYEAIKVLENIGNPYIDYYMGKIHFENEAIDSAMIKFNQFIKRTNSCKYILNEFVISAYYYLGILYYKDDQITKSRECFKVCIEKSDTTHKMAVEWLEKIKQQLGE